MCHLEYVPPEEDDVCITDQSKVIKQSVSQADYRVKEYFFISHQTYPVSNYISIPEVRSTFQLEDMEEVVSPDSLTSICHEIPIALLLCYRIKHSLAI